MRIIYYYHIPKTGGSTIKFNLKKISSKLPYSKFYNFFEPVVHFNQGISPLKIDFNKILSKKNIEKYENIFIHHHHSYEAIMVYQNILIKKKKELEDKGHTFIIFSSVRDVLAFNNSRINFITRPNANDPINIST